LRAFNKTILLGIVLISLALTGNTFSFLGDTSASFSDTKHTSATITAALWDTQAELVGMPGLTFAGIGNGLNETNNTSTGDQNL